MANIKYPEKRLLLLKKPDILNLSSSADFVQLELELTLILES
jgi:hypothetical protein